MIRNLLENMSAVVDSGFLTGRANLKRVGPHPK
jgi:hypothetical protein